MKNWLVFIVVLNFTLISSIFMRIYSTIFEKINISPLTIVTVNISVIAKDRLLLKN